MMRTNFEVWKSGQLFTFVLAATVALVLACGSGDGDPSATDTGDDGDSGLVEDRVFARAEAVFTMDDLIASGYKKSKEFEISWVIKQL